MPLSLAPQPVFTLEDLDQFGSLDDLPHSLDDPAWNERNVIISGSTVSPTGTYIYEYWTISPEPLISISPTGTLAQATKGIAPLVPLYLTSPSGAVIHGRFRGHDWITRAV